VVVRLSKDSLRTPLKALSRYSLRDSLKALLVVGADGWWVVVSLESFLAPLESS
jgi:hypothetical protein